MRYRRFWAADQRCKRCRELVGLLFGGHCAECFTLVWRDRTQALPPRKGKE